MLVMSIYRKDDRLADACENGIWLDYREHTFLFMLKDSVWTREECNAAGRNPMKVHFVQKGILDLFLAEIEDCFECSDLPFCIKEADESLLSSLHDDTDYRYETVLVSGDGTVMRVREGRFSTENSRILKQKLAARLQEDYTPDDFARAYEKNAARFEPYELETYAVFTERTKRG